MLTRSAFTRVVPSADRANAAAQPAVGPRTHGVTHHAGATHTAHDKTARCPPSTPGGARSGLNLKRDATTDDKGARDPKMHALRLALCLTLPPPPATAGATATMTSAAAPAAPAPVTPPPTRRATATPPALPRRVRQRYMYRINDDDDDNDDDDNDGSERGGRVRPAARNLAAAWQQGGVRFVHHPRPLAPVALVAPPLPSPCARGPTPTAA